MTDAQKLEVLVGRAIERELKLPLWLGEAVSLQFDELHPGYFTIYDPNSLGFTLEEMAPMILFNHDFARALFGGPTIDGYIDAFGAHIGKDMSHFKPYKYHLQQAIILPTLSEQIDYMYKAVLDHE